MKHKSLIAAITVSSWAGLLIQLALLVGNSPGNGMTAWQAVAHFFLFFTILTNLLVGVTSLQLLRGTTGFFIKPASLSGTAVYIFVVGLIYNLLLRQLWSPQGWQLLADNLLHLITPLLFLAYWWLAVSSTRLKWTNAACWLIYPAVYLAYALLRGRLEGKYPYPFIDVNKLGMQQVLVNSTGMLLLFSTIGMIVIAITRWQAKRKPGLS